MRKLMTAGALIASGLAVSWIVQAGSLEPPPGPVGPTMKTLDQVEPRTPIHASDLPLTITTPGSYYLAESIDTTGGGISINANDVSIDLMGFSLRGGTGHGISATGGKKNLIIRNGTVAGWGASGVYLSGTTNTVITDIIAENNTEEGIRAGFSCTVTRCIAANNEGHGIVVPAECTVRDSVAKLNTGSGFVIQGRSTAIACQASENTMHGFSVSSARMVNCVASQNTMDGINSSGGAFVTGCTASYNGDDGIDGGEFIADNLLDFNTNDGIVVLQAAHIVNNHAIGSGNGIEGAGIHIEASAAQFTESRIEGNTVSRGDYGILVESASNIIVKNIAGDNFIASYSIVAGNQVGTIVTSPIGAGPWDNISY